MVFSQRLGLHGWVLPLASRIDVARPQPVAGGVLSWNLVHAAAPVLKITQTDRLEFLLNFQIILGFFIGILTSVIASLLVEGRREAASAEPAQTTMTQREEHGDHYSRPVFRTRRAPSPWTIAALLAMALFGFLRRWRGLNSSSANVRNRRC